MASPTVGHSAAERLALFVFSAMEASGFSVAPGGFPVAEEGVVVVAAGGADAHARRTVEANTNTVHKDPRMVDRVITVRRSKRQT